MTSPKSNTQNIEINSEPADSQQFAHKQTTFEYNLTGKTATAHANLDTQHFMDQREKEENTLETQIIEFEQYIRTHLDTYERNMPTFSSSSYVLTPDMKYKFLLEKAQKYIENINTKMANNNKEYELLKAHNEISESSLSEYIGEIEEVETEAKNLKSQIEELEKEKKILLENEKQILLNQDLQFGYMLLLLIVTSTYFYLFGLYGIVEIFEVHIGMIGHTICTILHVGSSVLGISKNITDWTLSIVS